MVSTTGQGPAQGEAQGQGEGGVQTQQTQGLAQIFGFTAQTVQGGISHFEQLCGQGWVQGHHIRHLHNAHIRVIAQINDP